MQRLAVVLGQNNPPLSCQIPFQNPVLILFTLQNAIPLRLFWILVLKLLNNWTLSLRLCGPGRPDSSQTSWLHRPRPRPGRAPDLPAAGKRLHPDVALPAVPALLALRAPRCAHVRGLPGALLPEVRFPRSGPQWDHRGAPDLHRDVLPGQGTRLHAAQQWVLNAEGAGFWIYCWDLQRQQDVCCSPRLDRIRWGGTSELQAASGKFYGRENQPKPFSSLLPHWFLVTTTSNELFMPLNVF